MKTIKILFVCTHNGARGRIAKAFTDQAAPGRVDAYCASFESGRIMSHPVDVLKETGLDLDTSAPKSVFDRYRDKEVFDYVIKLCDAASTQQCPVLLSTVDTLYEKAAQSVTWQIPSLKSLRGDDEEKLAGAREFRDRIKKKVSEFISQIGIDTEY